MTIDELLTEARTRAITLWADGDRLRVSAPAGALTPELQAELSRHKAAILDRLRAVEAATAVAAAIPPVPRDERLPLSFGQERLWFIQQIDPESAAYNIFTVLPIKDVDFAALERSVTELVRRHEPLRTIYPLIDGQPVQQILPPSPVTVTVTDLRTLDDAARAAEAQRVRFADVRRPFRLANGPVIRFRLIRHTLSDSELLITQHHIATDGWSLSVMIEDLRAIYAAFAAGAPSPLTDPTLQYADFAVWQRQSVRAGTLDRQLAYWRRQLAGVQPLDLPADFPRPAVQTYNGASQTVWIGGEAARRLRALGRAEGASEFMALLAVLKILLAKYTGQTDLAVGTSNGARHRVELERMLGFFVQTQVLRSDLSGDPTVREVVRRVRQTAFDALANQDVPFETLVEELRPARDLSRSPFLDVMFIMQNTPLEALVRASEADVRDDVRAGTDVTRTWFASQTVETDAGSRVVMASGTSLFDLTVSLVDVGSAFRGVFEYNTDLFEHTTIARLASHFEGLVEAAAANPDLRISEISLLRPAEQRRFDQWNETTCEYERELTTADLFDAQVERTPDAIAVECGSTRLTYRELQRRADALAIQLQRQGLGPDARAGIFVERSINLVVAALAVLKSGGAYVPLDPIYPADRIAYMLEDAKASLVISESALAGTLPPGSFSVITIDAKQDKGSDPGLTPSESLQPERRASAANLAYVIYTSGSTGRPKGVQIPHGALVNFLTSMADRLELPPAARLLAVTTLCFDIAALELYLPLVTGGTVIVATRDETADAARLLARIRQSRPSVMQATPATWRMLLEAGWTGDRDLRILCGGEALPRPLANELVPRCAVLWNMYGPTETTIWSAVDRVTAGTAPVLVGHPIANTDFCVLDRHFRPVPIGVAGELFIGGDGLARGYFNRPDLTAAAFIPHPFAKTPGARLYRTGDLVRFRPDGRIEWLSRIDHQVKLRGFRIELGEIESVLAKHADVEQAVARVREDVPGDARLVAYIVPVAGRTVDTAALKELAGTSLPQYMHPAAYVILDALPMTPNGKVDRAALPAPDRSSGTRETVAPRSEVEERIAAIWRDVLRLETVSVRENFFELGGHSLLLVQVQARLSRDFGRDVPVVDLFRFPTVETLARHLAGEAPATTFAEQAASRVRRRTERGSGFIAVVGMAGRFPAAADVDTFWTNLQHGVEGIRQFTEDELRAAGVDDRWLASPEFVRARGFLEGSELFDAAFFGYTPREAALMDPQQRLFLECAYEALERAGYNPRAAGAVGVFGGSSMNTYLPYVFAQGGFADVGFGMDVLMNVDKDHLATRVSYKLNLKGPGVTVQTACSTSLVAVHLACRSLLDGECDMALAGGASVVVPTLGGYQYVEGNIFSPDGHCRPFDENAQGTVIGSGVGIVVLKRLDEAIADGDRIRAVIRGTAINNDGSSKVGYMAPSVEGQAEAIAAAHAAAGVDPDTIEYVEAHGTGTKLGDPIEIQALSQVFAEKTSRKQYCAIGALKSNIGHLDAAAGVASLIKAVLTIEHAELPPTINYERPHPQIDFANSPFVVNSERRPWITQPGRTRRAGVSSFGLGGTNAHAVLEEAPSVEPSAPGRAWQPFVLSARTEEALERQSARLAAYLREHADVNLADLAFTLQDGRESFDRRRVVVADSAEGAAAALEDSNSPRSWKRKTSRRPSIVFVFPDESAGYDALAKQLMSWGIEPSATISAGAGFDDGIAALLEKGSDLFVEIGGDLTLGARVQQIAAARGAEMTTIPLDHTESDAETLAAAIGRLWLHGAEPRWRNWHGEGRRLRLELPAYPFERKRHWIEPSPQAATARTGAPAARQAIDKNADVTSWFSTPSWKSTVSPLHATTSSNAPATWLVFADDSALAASVIASIRSRGAVPIVVSAGKAFESGPDRFTIDPAAATDCVRLWTSLSEGGRTPQGILHLWGVNAAGARDDIGAEARDRAFYSVLHLAQALGSSAANPVRLAVVTSGAERVTGAERLRPLHAAIRGLARVIPQELDHVVTATIDVEEEAAVEDGIADHLLAEVANGLTDAAVAYRAGTRWVQSYEALPIAPPARERLPIRENGVYLITGGLGRVGLDFAEHLAATGKAHVVLTRRSEFPAREDWDAWVQAHDASDSTSRAIDALRRIEAHGGTATVLAADAADEAQMRRVIETIDRRHGALHGVIHAAGALSDGALGPLSAFDRTACERQFAAKMDGVQVLDRLLAGRPLEFRLLMSSLSAVLGGIGYGIYASANAFLDAFAASRARGSADRWLSVNWDGWRQGSDTGAPRSTAERFSMTSPEGVEALDRVLSVTGVTQIVVSTGDVRARMAEWLSRGAPSAERRADPAVDDRPELDEAYVAPRNDIEETIAGIWTTLFGISRIGVHDNFFALGGHSLLATRLASRVRQAFQVSLGLDALFAAPTIAGLADAVMEQMLAEVDDDALLNDLRGV